MRTKRYWVNRYNDFIKKVLGGEVESNNRIAETLREERSIYLEKYLPKIKENPKEVREIVIFLHINHELNLLDPIGCCYPTVIYEYSSYAYEIVERFFNEDKKSFSKNLRKEIVDMWECVYSKPDRDKEIIDKGCEDIINILYMELLQGKENIEEVSDDNYWLKQFYLFINDKLESEMMKYRHKAFLLQLEVDMLLEEKENNLAKDQNSLVELIHFLYMNHQLNLLDPTDKYYPGLTYPYEKFAWEIVNAYRENEEEEFEIKVEGIIHRLYEYLSCDVNKGKYRIDYRIREIQETLKALNK